MIQQPPRNHSGDMTAPQPPSVSFRQAFWYWLRLGFISFGGPAGQIAIMHEDLVERRRWISERRFLHALNYCMMLPGPEAQQLATYIGWLMHRTWGGIVAGALFVLPSLLLLMALAWVYLRFGDVPAISGVLYGIKPAVTAIVIAAAWRIGTRTLKNGWLWSIAVAAFLAVFALNVPFPLIIGVAAVAGWLLFRMRPDAFAPAAAVDATVAAPAALIDDHASPASHTQFTWKRFAIVLLSGLMLWAVVMLALAALYGVRSVPVQMGWFFTKAALMTFGGAYAVLPYVFQGAVEHFQWLNAAQMMDGLALGETTPGPLIMIVAFVGFVGGWSTAFLGPEHAGTAAILAACVVTYFTFLPSFIFILLGGPFIESTHGVLALTAPLTAITAAVVGVIVNLAVFFAHHVLWAEHGHFDVVAAAIGLTAALALIKYKVSIIPVIMISATVGILISL